MINGYRIRRFAGAGEWTTQSRDHSAQPNNFWGRIKSSGCLEDAIEDPCPVLTACRANAKRFVRRLFCGRIASGVPPRKPSAIGRFSNCLVQRSKSFQRVTRVTRPPRTRWPYVIAHPGPTSPTQLAFGRCASVKLNMQKTGHCSAAQEAHVGAL